MGLTWNDEIKTGPAKRQVTNSRVNG